MTQSDACSAPRLRANCDHACSRFHECAMEIHTSSMHVEFEIERVRAVRVVDDADVDGTFVLVHQHGFDEITAERARIAVSRPSLA